MMDMFAQDSDMFREHYHVSLELLYDHFDCEREIRDDRHVCSRLRHV